jgi:Gram-negative bacterial TonB protein C-terminal
MASVATIESVKTSRLVEAPPFSLIEPKGLGARLRDELMRAASEFASDPKGFVRSLVAADAKDTKRRRLIYAGLAFALVAHVVFVAIAAIAGWHRIMAPPKEDPPKITMLSPPLLVESPGVASEKPPGKSDGGGGGGGGQQNPLPASKGQVPQSIPQSAVVDMRPSDIPNPALPIPPTIRGPESPPPPPGPIGDPNGKPAAFSGGRGEGGGIGDARGPGVGNVGGPGGPGGKAGGKPGYSDGTGNGIAEVNFSNLSSYPSYTPFSWLRRPTPVITPEAQENKVIGIVLLRATFHADGTVGDIEIVMPVDYMTQSAIDSLMRSKFRPATVNGKPITVRKVPIKIFVHY